MELRIKDILKEKGLTIKDIADKMGMDASNLNSSLKKGNPRLSTLADIANAIGCDITELFKPNEETANAPKGNSQALVLIDGEAYRLTRAKDVVRLPTYTNYAELRSNLKGFVMRAEKVEKKNRQATELDLEPFCLMGMVETLEVFNLLFVPETATFYLSLCYKNGKYKTYSFDARYEFNNPDAADGSWDTDLLYTEIRNDIENPVLGKNEDEIHSGERDCSDNKTEDRGDEIERDITPDEKAMKSLFRKMVWYSPLLDYINAHEEDVWTVPMVLWGENTSENEFDSFNFLGYAGGVRDYAVENYGWDIDVLSVRYGHALKEALSEDSEYEVTFLDSSFEAEFRRKK